MKLKIILVFCLLQTLRNVTCQFEQLYEGDPCKLMNSDTFGECRKVTSCPSFMKLDENKQMLRKWRSMFNSCGFIGNIKVICCPELSNTIIDNMTTKRVTENLSRNKIPRKSILKCEEYIAEVNKTAPIGPQILNGVEAFTGEFPHMVAIGMKNRADNKISYSCGGSLISDRYVLTAAHCVRKSSLEAEVVKLGVVYLLEVGDMFKIEEIIVYPEYKGNRKYHDIALLRLNQSVEFRSYMHPACLYTEDADPDIPLTVTGWGQMDENISSKSDNLMKANLTSVSRTNCLNIFTNFKEKDSLPDDISETQLCARDIKSDTCPGDSGGPLQIPSRFRSDMWIVVGITSFGRTCGEPVPSVYTRVSKYLDWIEGIVWKD